MIGFKLILKISIAAPTGTFPYREIALLSARRHFRLMSPQTDWFGRLMLVTAGFLGIGGVASAAGSSHFNDNRVLGAVALIALTHAPAALTFGLISPPGRVLRAGAIAVGTGACLFSATLTVRQFLEIVIFPFLAPTSAGVIVIGWAMVAAAGLFHR